MFVLIIFLLLIAIFISLSFLIPLNNWFFFLWVPLSIILSALILICFALIFIKCQRKTKPNRKFKHFILRRALYFSLILLRTPMKVYGKENLPKEMGYTVYGNHKSNMDVVYAYADPRIRYED